MSTSSSAKRGQFWRTDWFVACPDRDGRRRPEPGHRLHRHARAPLLRLRQHQQRAHAVRPHRGHRHRRPEHRQHRPLAVAARRARQLIDQLAAAKAKVIGNTAFFFEPQVDPGLATSTSSRKRSGPPPTAGRAEPACQAARRGRAPLNTDRAGRQHKKAGNVLVPIALRARRAAGQARQAAARVRAEEHDRRDAAASSPAGHARPASDRHDRHRGRRRGPPQPAQRRDGARALRAAGDRLLRPALPSLSLMLAAQEPEPPPTDIKVDLGESGRARQAAIRTDDARADVHLLLQGPRRQAAPSRSTRSTTSTRQDPGRQVRRQDRADRRRPPPGVGAAR